MPFSPWPMPFQALKPDLDMEGTTVRGDGNISADQLGLENKCLRFTHTYIYDLTYIPIQPWWKAPGKSAFWDVHLCATCFQEPVLWCAGCYLPCCFAMYQRKLLLGSMMHEDYSCCQDKCGKCWCTPIWRLCPHTALLCEAFTWTGCSISGNRAQMKKRHFRAKETCSEKIILITGNVLDCFGLLCAWVGCLCWGCKNSQQEHEWIKRTPPSGLTCYCDWKDHGGKFHEFYRPCQDCQPCCGDPWNPLDALYCFACWFCCGWCNLAQMLAWQNDQDCQLINHCGFLWLVFFISSILPPPFTGVPTCLLCATFRHNARVKADIGRKSDWASDCVIANAWIPPFCFIPYLGWCQQLRSQPMESWDWLRAITKGKIGLIDPEFKYIIEEDEETIRQEKERRKEQASEDVVALEQKKQEKKEKKEKKKKEKEKEAEE